MNELDKSLIRVCDVRGETKGTGFVVSESLALAVTCAHVVEACGGAPGDRVRIVFHQNEEEREALVLAEFWRASDADDIAVLRIEDGMPQDVVTPVRLGRTLGTESHRCATLGYPRVGTLQGVEGRGEIYQSVREANGRQLIQLASREITAGFSGAPLLDQVTGRVVAMITEIAEPDRYGRLGDTAFATPAEILYQLLFPLCPDLRLHHPQAVEDYLKAVVQFCRDLPYVSLKSEVPLETVYVRQQMRQESLGGKRPSDEKTPARKEQLASELSARPMTVTQALEQHPRLVVVGGPGAGKSTLLRHLVQGLAEGTSEWHPHLPILVSLRGLAEQRSDMDTSLRETVGAELGLGLQRCLPENFLADWASQTDMPWLIALDGLDEIVNEQDRRDLIGKLKQVTWPPGSRVLITTRPDISSPPDGFTAFELLPFEPEQVEEFAHNWFEPDKASARAFLKVLEDPHLADLARTPLLLTVAATIFESPHVSSLRDFRRSKLYGEFVRILLDEDAFSGRQMKAQFREQFRTDLGEWLFDYRREVLEWTALALQEERDVRVALRECLQEVVGWSARDAQEKTNSVLEILVQQRARLVVRRGDRYEFVNPSFREYLAASALVRACNRDLQEVWRRGVSRWREVHWREVALFVMGVLSDESKDVTPLLEQIWGAGDNGLYFAGAALADQVRVSDYLANQIVDALLAKARRLALSELFRHPNAVESLSRLGAYARAAEGLLTLARDDTVEAGVRLQAAIALGKLGQADDVCPILLTLACKEMMRAGVRCYAATALGELGRPMEAAQAWLALARDGTISAPVRLHAITALKKLERGEEAAPVLLALARDRELDDWVRLHAAKMLMELGGSVNATLAWLALARDPRMEAHVHLQAATALKELGKIEEAAPILLELAWADDRDVCRGAVTALGELGRVDDLLTLARDQTAEADVRLMALIKLAKLGRVNDTVPIALELVSNPTFEVMFWKMRTQLPGEGEQIEDVVFPILLAMVLDPTVESENRLWATEELGKFGDARFLSALEQIAQQEDVRRAAREAMDQIRRIASE